MRCDAGASLGVKSHKAVPTVDADWCCIEKARLVENALRDVSDAIDAGTIKLDAAPIDRRNAIKPADAFQHLCPIKPSPVITGPGVDPAEVVNDVPERIRQVVAKPFGNLVVGADLELCLPVFENRVALSHGRTPRGHLPNPPLPFPGYESPRNVLRRARGGRRARQLSGQADHYRRTG